jgi:nucleoside triphosphate diphosphatase
VTPRLEELLGIMRRLRSADGCPWDREQTFASIAPHTIEEAYEVADAIEREDLAHLKDELGDLLFQVVFHAEMARERSAFDFEAVAGAICDKLVRRHPHVFGERRPLSAAEHTRAWEEIKAEERHEASVAAGRGAAAAAPSALDGVPQALPALLRAFKLSKRAARVGFDFEHPSQTADKVAEELAEVREAAGALDHDGPKPAVERSAAVGSRAPDPSDDIFEEVGDLLFAAANLARKLEVDAEAALRAANLKFERRFRAMEALAAARGEVFADLDLAAQERLWLDVKRAE